MAVRSATPGLGKIRIGLGRPGKHLERKAQIIELNIYGGMTYREIAEVLEISEATVDRELRFSRAWLQRELSDE